MTNNNKTHNPLVSVCVITYNSSKYVLETLDSIKDQTYQNIELIISDDCSKDNTIAICKGWIEKNKDRFVRTKLIESEKNVGIPANCNRGFKEANGEWIKGIAGDDALYPNAIECYVNFINSHYAARIIHARVDYYNNVFSSSTLDKERLMKYPASFLAKKKLNSKRQYNLLCISNQIEASTVFMQYSLWREIDGYDERIPLCEDWPMWLKVTKSGVPFYFIDQSMVKYRVRMDSTFGKESVACLFKRFFEMDNIVYKLYIKHHAAIGFVLMNRYHFYLRYFFDKLGLNNKGITNKLIFSFFNMPYSLLNKLIFRLG